MLILLSFTLTGCTLTTVEVLQEQASGLAGELTDGTSFGQTFLVRHNNLYRLDLYTATYARQNTHPVIFHLKEGPDDRQDLIRIELAASQISNSGPTVITFPPLRDAAYKTFYFYIESPGSSPGDAITVYREEKDVYPDGTMYVNGQPTGGDMAFIAYTQETFGLKEIWADFYSRASQDSPFFTFYGIIISIVITALIILSFWRTDAGEEN